MEFLLVDLQLVTIVPVRNPSLVSRGRGHLTTWFSVFNFIFLLIWMVFGISRTRVWSQQEWVCELLIKITSTPQQFSLAVITWVSFFLKTYDLFCCVETAISPHFLIPDFISLQLVLKSQRVMTTFSMTNIDVCLPLSVPVAQIKDKST